VLHQLQFHQVVQRVAKRLQNFHAKLDALSANVMLQGGGGVEKLKRIKSHKKEE
jgi:hypothetical protein